MLGSPAFGQADLTNCERELIHLAGSVQPHGVLLVLREPDLEVIQVSTNCEHLLGRSAPQLLQRPLADLGSDLTAAVEGVAAEPLVEPSRLRAAVQIGAGVIDFEGSVYRIAGVGLVLELEPLAAVDPQHAGIETVDFDTDALLQRIGIRGKPYERDIRRAYLDELNAAYTHFFFHYSASPLLVVNTSDIDFVNRPGDFEDLVKAVLEVRAGTHYYVPRSR